MKSFKEFSEKCCDECDELFDHVITEAEYQGRKVELNNPTRSNDGKKKFYVYVKNDKGNVIKLGFGDPNMEIKRDDPARRKSFRARHNCSDPGFPQIQSKVLELLSMESISKGGQLMKNFKEFITEKSVPNDPKLWSRAKALAKQKFDVYPSLCKRMGSKMV